jgi:hypothetical protein
MAKFFLFAALDLVGLPGVFILIKTRHSVCILNESKFDMFVNTIENFDGRL